MEAEKLRVNSIQFTQSIIVTKLIPRIGAGSLRLMYEKRNCDSIDGEILIDQNESDGSALHLKHERHVPHIDFNNFLPSTIDVCRSIATRAPQKHIKTSCDVDAM